MSPDEYDDEEEAEEEEAEEEPSDMHEFVLGRQKVTVKLEDFVSFRVRQLIQIVFGSRMRGLCRGT